MGFLENLALLAQEIRAAYVPNPSDLLLDHKNNYTVELTRWEERSASDLLPLEESTTLFPVWLDLIKGSFAYKNLPEAISTPLTLVESAIFQRQQSKDLDVEIQDGVWSIDGKLFTLKQIKRAYYRRNSFEHGAGSQVEIRGVEPLIFRHTHCDDVLMKHEIEERLGRQIEDWNLQGSLPSFDDFWVLLFKPEGHRMPQAFEVVTPGVRWLICRTQESPPRRQIKAHHELREYLDQLQKTHFGEHPTSDASAQLSALVKLCRHEKYAVYVSQSNLGEAVMRRLC